MKNDPFSVRLLAWFKVHGRHDLPWKNTKSIYRVWISEIMLQQTRVTTVIPYFERFMQVFPNVETLAKANLDQVLHLWTGLGYYARARNLHKTARTIVENCNGEFPTNIEEFIALPGIGRSTAGAILSLARDQRHPVLDGNVKRVLCRFHALTGDSEKKEFACKLWRLADKYTPEKDVADYTQAIMDLGATICTRRNPDCLACPLNKHCEARKQGDPHNFPRSKPKTRLPKKETVFAIIENDEGEFLLEKRPLCGIWGGLWCFPEFSVGTSIEGAIKKQYGFIVKTQTEQQAFKHTFSHFQLMITPILIRIDASSQYFHAGETGKTTWVNSENNPDLGFPAPVIFMFGYLNEMRKC